MSSSTLLRLLLAGAVALAACGESATAPRDGAQQYPPLAGLIVSDAAPGSKGGSTAAGGVSDVAWVSLPPGTLTNVTTVRIWRSSASSSATQRIPVIDGGFDPVPINASEGDEIVLEFTHVDGQITMASMRVPPRRRPMVLRTSPPAGRTDVALSVRLAVIFSEPIDPRSISPASVRLLAEGQTVPGQLEIPPAQPWALEFVPSDSLQPATTYELSISDVRDVQGDALEASYHAQFTTRSGLPSWDIAFVSNRTGTPFIYVATSNGLTIKRLTSGEAPAWSWDGSKIAFHRGQTSNGAAGMWVINADGSNERFIGEGWYPSWSPDGTRIAFNSGAWTDGGGIFVKNVDGSGGAARLISHSFADTSPTEYDRGNVYHASWSPDGARITFVRTSYGEPWESWTMAADGSNPSRLGGSGDVWANHDPEWSPDGRRIAVVKTEQGRNVGEFGIGQVIADFDADGSGIYRVHARPIFPYRPLGYVGNPDWSPDGREILFDQLVGTPTGGMLASRMRIFIVTLETGAVRQLIPDAVSPAFSEYADYDAAWARAKK